VKGATAADEAGRCILDHHARVRNRTIGLVERLPEELLDRTAAGEEQPLRWPE